MKTAMDIPIVITLFLTAACFGFSPHREHSRLNPEPFKARVDFVTEYFLWESLNNMLKSNNATAEKCEEIISNATNIYLNIDAKDETGRTLLFHASVLDDEKNSFDISKLLVERGADINIKNYDGSMPLHEVVQTGRDKLVKFFLENGADINAKNSAGDRAMEIAINEMNETEKGSITWQRFKKIIELLRKYRTSWKACHQYSLDPIPRILGGDAAKAEEFPWMAALGYPSLAHDGVAFECAGSLISDFYILTAAHCAKLDNQPIVARLGIIKLTDGKIDNAFNHPIKDIIRHPNYSSRTKKNDIALIRVMERVFFTNEIFPACLHTDLRDEDSKTKLIVTGWGSTSRDETTKLSESLLKAQLISMPLEECNTMYLNYNKLANELALRYGITQGQYCAYDPQGRNDSCQGDSGGPLQIIDSSMSATIVGIVSFGAISCSIMPGIYTRVAYYLDWIEPIVWPND